jgi:hypothetical protein
MNGPPGTVVAIVAIVFMSGAAVLVPLVKAFASRLEHKPQLGTPVPGDLGDRLDRIERSVEAVAIEVERISEGQRFVTKLLAERETAPRLPPTA